MPDLSVSLVNRDGQTFLSLKNPVTVASGTFGSGLEYASYCDLGCLGALTTKAVTLESRQGNPGQRVYETPAGMLNSIGLMNSGVEHFCHEVLPQLRQIDNLPLIVNVSGSTVEEYAAVAERLNAEQGIAALEINVSCPNVHEGGMAFGTSPGTTAMVTQAVRKRTKLPIFIKLTPNVTDIAPIVRAVEDAGADGFSLINTVLGMAIDIDARKPVFSAIFAGLSGPAVRPIALRMVYQVYQVSKLPIIGMGGISTWQDALQFILAGASVIAVGTANFANPRVTMDIIQGLQSYCSHQGVDHLQELVGLAHK